MTAKANTTDTAVTDFDLDAFLGGAKVPTKQVRIYTNGPALVRLHELQESRTTSAAATRVAEAAASWGDPDGRSAPAGVDQDRLDDEIKAARAELDASAATFEVRSLDSDDGDEVVRRYPEKRNATDKEKRDILQKQIVAQMSMQIIAPRTFTEQELTRIRKAIGEPEFTRLWQACLDVNQEITVDSPFSLDSFGSGRNS